MKKEPMFEKHARRGIPSTRPARFTEGNPRRPSRPTQESTR